jgi:hypothetical protein
MIEPDLVDAATAIKRLDFRVSRRTKSEATRVER